jgi:hypothetical protein
VTEFLKDSDREIYDDIIAIKTDHVSIELAVEMLQTDAVRQKIAEFKATNNRDPSLVFWMSYLAELHLQDRLLPILRSMVVSEKPRKHTSKSI